MEIRLYRDKLASKGGNARQQLLLKLWEAVGEERAKEEKGETQST